MKISVVITLKKDVLDPQGKVIHQTLDGMGFEDINEVRQGKYFEIDIKENGKNEVILADEISPDTCRLWDTMTDRKLDKDRFRKDLGDLIPAYTEVAKRLGILHEQSNLSAVNVTKLRSVITTDIFILFSFFN